MKVVMFFIVIGELVMIGGPLRGKDIMQVMGDHLIEVMIETEELLEEEDPLMVEDPLVMEDHLEMDDI